MPTKFISLDDIEGVWWGLKIDFEEVFEISDWKVVGSKEDVVNIVCLTLT